MTDIVKSHTLKTIREEFDEYILDDGNLLRCKEVLVAFGLGEPEKNPEGKMMAKTFVKYQQAIGIVPTADVDVSNLELANRNMTIKDRQNELKFTLKKTSLNYYETDEFIIVVRSKLNHIWTTPFKDNNNIPIYSIETDTSMDTIEKQGIALIKDPSSVESKP